MSRFALFLLAAAPLIAQNALWIDLAGGWRANMTEDLPEFAVPDFDDRQWKSYTLPANEQQNPPDRLWLRKTVVLPDGADRTRLALTLGTVNSVYEVFVNGVRVGATGGLNRWDYRIPRLLTFDLPASVVPAGRNTLTVAIRSLSLGQRTGNIWGFESGGPFLLTGRDMVPRSLGRQFINDRRVREIPNLALSVALLGLAAILLLAWASDTKMWHIYWFGLGLALEGARSLFRFLMIAEDTFPLRWSAAENTASLFAVAAFTHFVVLAQGFPQRWIRIGVWLAWSVHPLALLAGSPFANDLFMAGHRLQSTLAICLIGVAWWRDGALRQTVGSQAFAAALFLTALLRLNSMRGTLGLPASVSFDPFRLSMSALVLFVLALVIAVQMLRRLLADRKESQRLTAEMEAGRGVQQLLLTAPPDGAGKFRMETVYEPAQELGGDFHWSRTASDGSLLAAVGDVSGKGLKAAMLVSVAIGILRNEKPDSPGALLGALTMAWRGIPPADSSLAAAHASMRMAR